MVVYFLHFKSRTEFHALSKAFRSLFFVACRPIPLHFLSDCWPVRILCDKSMNQSEMVVGARPSNELRRGRDERLVCPRISQLGGISQLVCGARLTCTLQKFICAFCIDRRGTRKFCSLSRSQGDAMQVVICDVSLPISLIICTCAIGHHGLQINICKWHDAEFYCSLLQTLGHVSITLKGVLSNFHKLSWTYQNVALT